MTTGSSEVTPVFVDDVANLIDAHIAHIKAAGFSPNTISDREELLNRLNHTLPMGLEQATVEELAGYLATPGWTVQTRSTYYWHVIGFFRWACDPNRPLLDWNPAASLIPPRVPARLPRPVTNDQLTQALTESEHPWLRLVTLAAYSGLRCCELSTVRREHITKDELVVKGKGGKTRAVPTDPVVWRSVEDLPRGLVGAGRSAAYITSEGGRYLTSIGLPDVSMHRFRHWYATNLLRGGVDLLTVSKLMGHASPTTTAIYCEISAEQRQLAKAALPDLTPTPSS